MEDGAFVLRFLLTYPLVYLFLSSLPLESLLSHLAPNNVRITEECTGSSILALLISVIVNTDRPLSKRLLGVVFVSLSVLGINLIRIWTVGFVYARNPGMAVFLHEVSFRIFVLLASVGVFVLWLRTP